MLMAMYNKVSTIIPIVCTPFITECPHNQEAVHPGSQIRYSIKARGCPPQFNWTDEHKKALSADIANGISSKKNKSTLTINVAAQYKNKEFMCTVHNCYGSKVSDPVTLEVCKLCTSLEKTVLCMLEIKQ